MKKRLNLAITLMLFVFSVMMASLLLSATIAFVLHNLGILNLSEEHNNKSFGFLFPLLFVLFLCVVIGTALTGFFSSKALNPIRKVIKAIHKVSEGDFNVKVDIKGIGELEELSQSFNKMTHELSAIEALRSDFINNFSHEFKTPIVSVRGFAKLLRDGNLSEEEKQEYLNIIIAESERLADLSTNVLNLSRYENIDIVTERESFRMDEQIRRTLALLEPKWSAKRMKINVELDEILYNGNADLTKQIWINLIDNAIKFSNLNGIINIRLAIWNSNIRFIIQDNGTGMDEQTKAYIFDKFYQGDTSHVKAGYGLGLTLVKRIVELCGGNINVESEINEGSMFTVLLPN